MEYTNRNKTHLKFRFLKKPSCYLAANAAALTNGATFVNSNLFQVNEQKYFASTDGSYIDQDVHRIWPTFTVSGNRSRQSGKFKSRDAMKCPNGFGL
jgi:TldD protein